jgi:GTP-binding protein Era
LDNKVSIVSPKAQTTRERVRGVWTDVPSSTQIVFHDTPGVLPAEERSQFGIHSLADVTYGALETTDVGIVVVDAAFMVRAIASNGGELPVSVVQQIEDLTVKAERRIAVLNKTDLVSDKSSLLPTVKALQTAFPQTFSDVFLVSAIKGSGLQELRKYLLGVAPSGMWLYPPDLSTDQSQLKRATECIREAIFLRLNAELPYTLKIDIPSWTPFKNGDVRIDAEVIVQSRSQLRILIGENGQAIKWIREHAQEGIQQFLNRTVHLFVRGVMK